MLRTLLVSIAFLAALGGLAASRAAGLVSSYVVERGDARRVKDVSSGDEAAMVEVHFGMGRAANQGFVAAAGGVAGGVTVSRGPRTGADFCPEAVIRLR